MTHPLAAGKVGRGKLMDNANLGRLRVWDDPGRAAVREVAGPPHPYPLLLGGEEDKSGGTALPTELAEQFFVGEALHPALRLPRSAASLEPFTLQWFLSIEGHRHGRHGRWFPRLLEFAKHSGETLLGLGHGLGTDWLQYARHGASVIVCSPSAVQLSLVRRNFELRGLAGRFLHADPTSLPLESNSIDVACLTDLLQFVPDPRAVVAELFRVLKPGGKVLAVAPARYDVDFWCKRWFFWQFWLRRRPGPSRAGTRFTARGLRKLFGPFVEHRIHKRQLRRCEVPNLWRVLPLSLLERLMGRVLVLKAFKPLCSALPAQAAA
jgi:ubiquinone/menaquinone biosynthesis C-methylase UbiE